MPQPTRARRGDRGGSARTVTRHTDLALAEVIPEHGRPWRRTLRLDGEDASHGGRAAPRRSGWAYVRRLADAADALAPAGAPIDALHVGGGGFTLPRYIA